MAALAVAGTAAQAQARPRPKARPPPRRGRRAARPRRGKALYPQAQFDFMLKERTRAGPAGHAGARARDPRRAQHARAARARGEEEGPRQERRRQAPDGPRRADGAGARLRHRLDEDESDPRGRAAQGVRHDQDADRRQGIQGRAHPRREGRRGEGGHRRAAEGRQVRRAREGALEGPGLARTRGGDLDWNAPGELREAVLRRDGQDRRRASSRRSRCRRSSAGT